MEHVRWLFWGFEKGVVSAMDAASAEDLVFLAMTFLIAIGLTAAILIWGRVSLGREAR
jgi:hypothetical protein